MAACSFASRLRERRNATNGRVEEGPPFTLKGINMKTYIVAVKHTVLDYYEVAAESADEAMEIWMEGSFLHTDDAYLEAEAIRAEEKGA